jgi:PAS domain S-box-containing protein
VLYHAPDAIITLDDGYRVVDWNPGAEQIFGYTRTETLGEPLGSLIAGGDAGGELAHEASKILGVERVEAFETVRYRKDGTPVQVISAGSPIMVEGKLTGAVAMFTDITGLKKAEEEIRQRERMLRRLMDIVPSMIFVKNAEGRFLMVNQAVADFYGKTVEQIVGRLHATLHPDPTKVQQILADDRRVIESQEPMRVIEELRPEDNGATRWMETIKTPCDPQDFGEPAIVGLAMDITRRKQAEVALKEANQMLRLVLDTIPVRVFWKDRECRYLGCNQPFAEDGGRTSPMELLGKDDFSMTWAPEAELYRKDDLAVMATGRSKIDYEETQTTPGGGKIWVMTSKVPMRDGHGNITGILGTYQDITERKAAENEVRRLRNYLANIINSMPSMLVGVDAQGRITQWNTQAEKLTGLPFEKVNAKPLEAAVPLFKDDMARIQKAIRDHQVVHDPKVASQEDGAIRFQDITIYPLVANGVEGAVIRVDDVTERVRMEEMMIQSEKMLSVGGLAAGMAHEINNPLAGILQSASVLENRLLGDLPANDRAAQTAGTSMAAIGRYLRARKLPEMVSAIRTSGDRAAAIVRNMLSFARKGSRDIAPREMSALLDRTIELAGTDYDMKKQYDFKRIEIVREYDANTPTVPCEESKIQQVFLNILKNGAEAMTGGAQTDRPPRFLLRVNDEKQWVRVEIKDNGPGMPEALRKRIFEPFFTTKAVGQATGLGLSVSYFIIVEDHGGKMAVRSEPGRGSSFVIRLPKKRNEVKS